ncbi:sorbitol dehydrogenase-like [Oppia nitens]|uniref:sorbitol dehydrogenase-like n=1 Tax=Oppia nitens TaxID=1686743 RepID=UPI0023DBB856|nr:sorbitol dehydrogenase-like [Oppia nitens]XP_054160203.1 sorbitol dehydrogenase-like [Oppia nitens]
MSTKSAQNLSAVLHKVDDMRLEDWPMPRQPANNEVLLRTKCVGICGSDVHYWKHGSIGNFILDKPIILGHETCAEVVAVGPDVHDFKVGDRVCTEPAVPCRLCSTCKEGNYNLCTNISCHATPPHSGTLTKYFIHPADYTFKLPDHISDEEGAMIEPLTVAMYACKRAQVTVGKLVLVTGAGPIGLFNIMVAKALGADKILVTDINEKRLKLAQSVGADHTVLITKDSEETKLVKEIKETLGQMPDITIECSGAPSSSRLSLLATKHGGIVILVGHGPSNVSLPIADAAIREVNILGSFRYKNCFPLSISLVSSGKVDLKPLISHRFSFEQTLDAFNTAYKGEGVKIIINVENNKPKSGV